MTLLILLLLGLVLAILLCRRRARRRPDRTPVPPSVALPPEFEALLARIQLRAIRRETIRKMDAVARETRDRWTGRP